MTSQTRSCWLAVIPRAGIDKEVAPGGLRALEAAVRDHLGHPEAGAAVLRSIEMVPAERRLRTRDLGGSANAKACGKAVADTLS